MDYSIDEGGVLDGERFEAAQDESADEVEAGLEIKGLSGGIKWRVPKQDRAQSWSGGETRDMEILGYAARGRVELALGALKRLSELVDYCGFLLRLGQGPVQERLDIRWWRVDKVRKPVLVRWRKKGRKSDASLVKLLPEAEIVRSARGPLKPVVVEVVGRWRLLEKDWALMRRALQMGVGAGYLERIKIAQKIEAHEAGLVELHKRAQGHLIEMGVDIERGFTVDGVTGERVQS